MLCPDRRKRFICGHTFSFYTAHFVGKYMNRLIQNDSLKKKKIYTACLTSLYSRTSVMKCFRSLITGNRLFSHVKLYFYYKWDQIPFKWDECILENLTT